MNTTKTARQVPEAGSAGKPVRTRTIRAGLRLLIASAAVAELAVTAPTASAAPVRGDHAAARQVLDRAVAGGGVPGILARIREGRDAWVGSAGVADTGTGRRRREQDRFRIGSTTKTFTATVMLQLEAEHRLDLDDSVEKWLPGVVRGPGYEPEKISIRQLLNHTSGIYDYVNDEVMGDRGTGMPFLEHRFDSYRPEEIVRIGLAHPPGFAPGTDWAYSNTPYFLAGMIIERVTGRPLADAFAQRIARPLGLTATYLPRGDEEAIRGPSWGWAAGGVVSTTGDLDRFFGALLGGRLLPRAQQREMFTMVPTKNWIPDTAYGLGVASQKLSCGVTVWGMGGAINGSWTYTFGTGNGARMVSVNSNGDWNHPIVAFTDLLQAEFCPGTTQ